MEKQPFVDRFPRKPLWILHFYVCLLERKEQTIEDLREIQQQYWGNRRRVLLLSEQFGERMAVDHKNRRISLDASIGTERPRVGQRLRDLEKSQMVDTPWEPTLFRFLGQAPFPQGLRNGLKRSSSFHS